VNVSSMVLGWRQGRFGQWMPMLISLAGFATCFFIWMNLGNIARIVGTVWAFVGIVFWIVRRKQTVLPGDAPGAAA
jgi:putrescine importer